MNKYSLYFPTNLERVSPTLSAACSACLCRGDSAPRCFPLAGVPCAVGGVLSKSLVLFRTPVAVLTEPGSAQLALLLQAGLLSNIPACLEMGWGCTRLCQRGRREQSLGAASRRSSSYKLNLSFSFSLIPFLSLRNSIFLDRILPLFQVLNVCVVISRLWTFGRQRFAWRFHSVPMLLISEEPHVQLGKPGPLHEPHLAHGRMKADLSWVLTM